MIGWLKGEIVERAIDDSVIIEVRGVGYEVFLPLGTVGRLGTGEVTLFVHTHAREDALLLYGFETREDKAAFRALISVSKVGPRLAMAILGALDAPALAQAIEREDRAVFHKISGVGKKTAERLILDLKDKLHFSTSAPVGSVRKTTAPISGPLASASLALVELGFPKVAVDNALSRLDSEGKSAEALIREALGVL